jgi:ElaB/YqjD/DUF883 family membrane-anchored ribosome-binding protein
MKSMKWIFSFIFILGGLFILASCAQPVSAQDDTYITVDINPSVELIVNRKEIVIYANPLNEDGEVLLAELELVGLPLDEALDLVIQTAIELGYIDVDAEETFVSISAISKNSEMGEKMRERAKEHINNAFKNRAMMGRAEDKGFTPEFVAEAESYGVTPGFLFLAKTALIVDDELTLETALTMSVEELQAILKDAKQDMREVAQALKDEFLAARQALKDLYMPQFEAFEAEIAAKEAELLVLQEQLAAKQAELVEALEENKATIEAEIQVIEADITVLESEIAAINVEFAAVRAEFVTALHALRDEFHAQTAALREQIRNLVQSRRQMHQERVNQFFEAREAMFEQMKERIENWQKNRP